MISKLPFGSAVLGLEGWIVKDEGWVEILESRPSSAWDSQEPLVLSGSHCFSLVSICLFPPSTCSPPYLTMSFPLSLSGDGPGDRWVLALSLPFSLGVDSGAGSGQNQGSRGGSDLALPPAGLPGLESQVAPSGKGPLYCLDGRFPSIGSQE